MCICGQFIPQSTACARANSAATRNRESPCIGPTPGSFIKSAAVFGSVIVNRDTYAKKSSPRFACASANATFIFVARFAGSKASDRSYASAASPGRCAARSASPYAAHVPASGCPAIRFSSAARSFDPPPDRNCPVPASAAAPAANVNRSAATAGFLACCVIRSPLLL